MTRRKPNYPEAEPNPNFPAIEDAILERWKRDRTFENSVAARPRRSGGRSNEFVFYDGPPFANGLPHYGHLATGFVKDVIPRYQTMRGRHVERRFGWDCHGLPAELEVERETGISGRTRILEYGIENFNAKCRESVLRYTGEWRRYVTRQARWVDFDDEYKTMDLSYMESVIWAFKVLWDKGLIYESYRVVPYSWAAQTPLSNFETRLDNSYRERDDPALTVGFKLKPVDGESGEIKVLAWTTTPWTLPSNLALCVNVTVDYAIMEKGGERLILADAAVARYQRELTGYAKVGSVKGADLLGRRYEPMFPYFAATPGAFVVVGGDFVGIEDGTGVVHIAPGFGEEDLEIGKANGLPIVVPVDVSGAFTDEVPDYAGQNVILEANANIIRDLKARKGVVLRHEQYRHNYPHCWRTDQPLIYMAVNSWYVAVTKFRDRMVELNRDISWIPEHVREGLFGNWLANARDWNISRNRFWGAPLPIWRSDDPKYPRVDVYGSLDEIERDFGVRPTDLHRPAIDNLVRPNPDDPTGKSTMRRIPDVLDCWFESGSMPFAQLHYPFENRARFDENFPGDFIVEYVAQTRGWFYTLMVLSTALFDRAPFRNCVCHGVVLDEKQQKLSKRLRNYPDPDEMFAKYGADALRSHILSSPLMSGGDLALALDGSDIGKSMRQVILRFWNAYSFFTLYANADGIAAKFRTDSSNDLDRYILAKARQLLLGVQQRLDEFQIPGAYALMTSFVEILNNWYIRSRRASFWSEELDADKQAAFDTLYTVLALFCRITAPLMPLITERIYTALTGEQSVHLTDWPDAATLPEDADLLYRMDLARDVCSGVMTLRETHRRRTRLPLQSLIVAHPGAQQLDRFAGLIAEAVNVKSVTFTADVGRYGTKEIKVNPKLGARIGAKFKDVLAAQRANQWTQLADGRVEIAGVVLEAADSEIRIKSPPNVVAEPIDAWRGVVVLDITVYPELRSEGWARDFVRLVQQARKEADFDITDRITVTARGAPQLIEALEKHAAYVAGETLALKVDLAAGGSDAAPGHKDDIDGLAIAYRVERVSQRTEDPKHAAR